MKKNLIDCRDMNVKEFKKVAREIFAPMYPVLAEQTIEETKKTKGLCLDIGTGTGLFPIELAKRTKLVIYALDISEEMCKIAYCNVLLSKFSERMIVVKGDVHSLPFRDDFFDLIVSRGSFLFWHNQVKAFIEIYRVLKRGGMTFIGGGFGRDKEVRDEIKREMKKRLLKDGQRKEIEKRKGQNNVMHLQYVLKCAGVPKSEFKILSNESGIWLKIKKGEKEWD